MEISENLQKVLDTIENALTLYGGFEVIGGKNDNELIVVGEPNAEQNFVVTVNDVAK